MEISQRFKKFNQVLYYKKVCHFDSAQIKMLLTKNLKRKDPKELLGIMVIRLIYFGLLLKNETEQLKPEHIIINLKEKKIEVLIEFVQKPNPRTSAFSQDG